MNLREYINIFELENDSIQNYREQLYVSGTNLILAFNYYIDLTKENKEINLSQLANLLQISDKQLRAWRCGYSPIPLNILKIFSQENKEIQYEFENKIEYISSSRGKKIRIPRNINSVFIEILGRFSGDGSCGIYNGDYKWSLKEEGKALILRNMSDMESVFGISGKYIDYDSYAENLIRSKPLVLLFQQIFNYGNGFRKTYSIQPPSFLKDLNWNIRKSFSTGIIDTEGSFYHTNQSYFFEINMVNRSLIDEVASCFDEFSIPYNLKFGNKSNIKLISYGRTNIQLIYDIFKIKNSKHLIKLEKFGI